MARKRYRCYAVKVGQRPGVYQTWEQCRVEVEGYPNAVYQGFMALEEARRYLKESPEIDRSVERIALAEPAMATSVRGPVDASGGRKRVVVYSDGACLGNPGPGGYGAVIIYGQYRKELSAGFRLTTNNRMEMLGCIAGL